MTKVTERKPELLRCELSLRTCVCPADICLKLSCEQVLERKLAATPCEIKQQIPSNPKLRPLRNLPQVSQRY